MDAVVGVDIDVRKADRWSSSVSSKATLLSPPPVRAQNRRPSRDGGADSAVDGELPCRKMLKGTVG